MDIAAGMSYNGEDVGAVLAGSCFVRANQEKGCCL